MLDTKLKKQGLETSLNLLKDQDKDMVILLEEVVLGMLGMEAEEAQFITWEGSMVLYMKLGRMEVQEVLEIIMVTKNMFLLVFEKIDFRSER